MVEKLEMTLSRLALAFAVSAFGAWMGWMISDDDIPVVVTEKRAVTPLVKRGEVFRAHYKFFRTRQCLTNVARHIKDGEGYRHVIPQLDFVVGALPLGWDSATVPATVPPNAAPGPAVYTTINCYSCNALQMLRPNCDQPRDIHFLIE